MSEANAVQPPDRLRDRFIASNGFWSAGWEAVRTADPDFFAACVELMAAPRLLGALSPRMRELVLVAINVACTHNSEDGTRRHLRRALEVGATPAEIGEVIELAAVLGIHSCTVGVPILLAHLDRPPMPPDGERQRLKDVFIAQRGYWSPLWDGLLEHSPAFFAAYTHFSSLPWAAGVLAPKDKELVYVAIDIATSHLFVPGTDIHIRNALKHGATTAEVLEVIETVSLLGLDAAALGFRILQEERQRAAGVSAEEPE